MKPVFYAFVDEFGLNYLISQVRHQPQLFSPLPLVRVVVEVKPLNLRLTQQPRAGRARTKDR